MYNFEGGPTYRCLYPTPPPPTAVTNCSEGGVLGAVPGVVGVLQALEAVKILAGLQPSYSGTLWLFDGLEGRSRVVKLRKRREGVDQQVVELIDYEQFCGSAAHDQAGGVEVLAREERVTAQELQEVRRQGLEHLVVDVRLEVEQEMCRLEGSVALPLAALQAGGQQVRELLQPQGKNVDLFLICRRGNDSQEGVRAVRRLLGEEVRVRDVVGGLHAWAGSVDRNFPLY